MGVETQGGGNRAGPVADGRPHRKEGKHPTGGRKAQHALVEQHAEVTERTKHLDAHHEDDEQCLEGHGPRSDAMHAPAEGDGRPECDAYVGDAPGQRVRPEDAHGRPEQLAAPLCQERRAGGALAERLQRAEPLEGVEELRPEGAVGPLAREAPSAVPPVPEARREERQQGRPEQDERDRAVQPRHEGEDEHGGQD